MKACLLLLRLVVIVLLPGCASISQQKTTTADYISLRRSDVLTTGSFSASAREEFLKAGIGAENCSSKPDACLHELLNVKQVLLDDQWLATLAEVSLFNALKKAQLPDRDTAISAWLETVRYSYAYLFDGKKPFNERALENRQIQVRDYYNLAVQQVAVLLFQTADSAQQRYSQSRRAGLWKISTVRPINFTKDGDARATEVVPAASLQFAGIRSNYRRDGLGAELVAVLPDAHSLKRSVDSTMPRASFQEMHYPVVTAVIEIEGETLEEVLRSHSATFYFFDPYQTESLDIQKYPVVLSADFTAGYGLWLARSDFSSQPLATLLGMDGGIDHPTVFLMQPYDPKRHIIVMIHGLASSPDAWVNMANEIMGDEALRQKYQIWQVYYPTNAPILVNHFAIRQALADTFNYFDPHGKDTASKNVTLIGHSMGGVIARLMVSSSAQVDWTSALENEHYGKKQTDDLRTALKPYVEFEPVPYVNQAIFLAAPHKGTSFAAGGIGGFAAKLVSVPFVVLGSLGKLAGQPKFLVSQEGTEDRAVKVPNSIDNLSLSGRFAKLFGSLPIPPSVSYHSIIGQENPTKSLWESDDGIVPYASAHIDGAQSELVVHSSHSVQEAPEAILEIRRILKLPVFFHETDAQ